MSISASDIEFRYTASSKSSSGTANGSLGGYASTTKLADNTLFDMITGAENAAKTTDYRCLAVVNTSTETWHSAVVWVSNQVSGGADASIGLDAKGVVTMSSSLASRITNETTAPSGVTFSDPTKVDNGLAVGDVGAGKCFAVWLKRSATDSAAKSDDGVTISVRGDTG
jgi:hypothetical protein